MGITTPQLLLGTTAGTGIGREAVSLNTALAEDLNAAFGNQIFTPIPRRIPPLKLNGSVRQNNLVITIEDQGNNLDGYKLRVTIESEDGKGIQLPIDDMQNMLVSLIRTTNEENGNQDKVVSKGILSGFIENKAAKLYLVTFNHPISRKSHKLRFGK